MSVQFVPAAHPRLIGDYDSSANVVRDAHVVLGTVKDGSRELEVGLPVTFFNQKTPGRYEAFNMPPSNSAFLPFGQPMTLDLIG